MRAILAAAIVAMVPAAAQAQVREIITVQQGAQTVLQFAEPFSAASVGDTNVIDAMPRSDRVIVIQGKQTGVTDLLAFFDGKAVRHITVTVTPPNVAGKVLTHNKKNLSDYMSYSCSAGTCARMKDDTFESDVLLFGPGGTVIGVGNPSPATRAGTSGR
jgi:hypothetical protein